MNRWRGAQTPPDCRRMALAVLPRGEGPRKMDKGIDPAEPLLTQPCGRGATVCAAHKAVRHQARAGTAKPVQDPVVHGDGDDISTCLVPPDDTAGCKHAGERHVSGFGKVDDGRGIHSRRSLRNSPATKLEVDRYGRLSPLPARAVFPTSIPGSCERAGPHAALGSGGCLLDSDVLLWVLAIRQRQPLADKPAAHGRPRCPTARLPWQS